MHASEIGQHEATTPMSIGGSLENCMRDASRGWHDVMQLIHRRILQIRFLGPSGTNFLILSNGARGGKGKRMISHVSIHLEVSRNNVYCNTMALSSCHPPRPLHPPIKAKMLK